MRSKLLAVLAGVGLVLCAIPTGASASAGSWKCTAGWKDATDGDKGGVSGGVTRYWESTGHANADAEFQANGEKLYLRNKTSTTSVARLMGRSGQGGIELGRIKLSSVFSDHVDLDLAEGMKVWVEVSISGRGSCTSPLLTT